LVLEDEARARSRGAPVRAAIRGFAGAFDASAPRVGWGRGASPLATALRGLLTRAGLEPPDVGRIVSGASGAIAGDRLEAHTLRKAWREHPLPPILAPKGVTGQYGGGFLAAGVLAMSDLQFAPTVGFSEPDPDLGVIPHGGEHLPAADILLMTSLASGGSASWLLFEKA
jgi:minimal PKS chain-length factor (CLF/KS beta)